MHLSPTDGLPRQPQVISLHCISEIQEHLPKPIALAAFSDPRVHAQQCIFNTLVRGSHVATLRTLLAVTTVSKKGFNAMSSGGPLGQYQQYKLIVNNGSLYDKQRLKPKLRLKTYSKHAITTGYIRTAVVPIVQGLPCSRAALEKCF